MTLFSLFSRRRRRAALSISVFAGSAALSLIAAGCGGGGGAGGGGAASPASDRAVNIAFAAQDLHGTVPVTVQIGTGMPSTHFVDSNGVTMNVGATPSSAATVPAVYGDRAFVKWQKDGQDLGASPTLNFTPLSVSAGGPVTAVYAARSADASGAGYTPNYWQTTFPHWDHFPLKVNLDATTIPAGSPTASAITTGLDRWVQASGGLITYQLTDDPTQADVQIAMGTPPSGAAGVCYARWYADSTLKSATITLLTPTMTDSQGRPLNLDTAAAHEFGHSLGMIGTVAGTGHSTDSNDTMYPTGNTVNPMITARDLDTVASIYPNLFSGTSGRGIVPGKSAAPSPSGALRQATVY